MKNKEEFTNDWMLFLSGQNYNEKLDPPFNQTININNSMYIGDQWKGVKANGNPTPVFNIFKRIINHQIASITSSDTKMQIASSESSEKELDMEMTMDELTDVLSAYFDTIWEDTKMTSKIRQLLLDGALSGDYCIYSDWNDLIGTKDFKGVDKDGNPVEIMGQIENSVTDSVNVFFGNPNDKRVNENGRPIQPYIIVAFRQMTNDLIKEAKANGISKAKRDLITSDKETTKLAGYRGNVELDEARDESGKTTAIVKMWVEDGIIQARKSTRQCVIREQWNTKRTLYPLTWGNWDSIKNSYHGQALGTGLVPNQLFINKQFAMSMVSLMNNAYPKVVYDKTRIGKWSNSVGSSFGVEGDITGVAQQLNPGTISPQVMQFIDATINYTKEMLGSNDASMGNVTPDNASAIIAVQQAAAIPLETIKMNMYQFVEDLGYIWLDTMIAYYGERDITVEIIAKDEMTGESKKQKVTKTIDFAALRNLKLKLKIDVGASSYWAQISAIQTLDNLLAQDRITFMQYLEGLPVGILNNKEDMISTEKDKEEQQKAMLLAEQQAQVPGVPYEVVEELIKNMPQEMQQAAIEYVSEQEKANEVQPV